MKQLSYFTILLILLFSACTERIDINLNTGENNRLVVEGGITNEKKIHRIKLTRSANYFANVEAPKELGAIVTISNDEQVFALTDDNNDGIYETASDTAGIPNKDYTLNIKLSNGSTYTANCFMKSVLPMDSITYMYERDFDPEVGRFDSVYKILIYAFEPEPIGDYYLWDLFLNDVAYTDTLSDKVFQDDGLINGNYITAAEFFRLSSSEIENDTVNVRVVMQSISKAQYNFILSVLLETVFKGSPFDGPPANVPTNISNGALGFFYANSTTYLEKELYKGRNP